MLLLLVKKISSGSQSCSERHEFGLLRYSINKLDRDDKTEDAANEQSGYEEKDRFFRSKAN